MLMDGPHGSREAKEAHDKKIWGGPKPKTVSEVAAWRERNGGEPEPESEDEADEDDAGAIIDAGMNEESDDGAPACRKRKIS